MEPDIQNLITINTDSPAVKYLCQKDKRMAKVIYRIGSLQYATYRDGYAFIIHEIIEQMLSKKTAQTIYERLLNLCDGKITPAAVAGLSDNQILGIGTSVAKAHYIRSVTDAFISGEINLAALERLSDADVIKELSKLRGVGSWTAKMYLIFVMDRPDVLPFEDGAFLQSYRWLYKSADTSAEAIKKRCKKWHPYSSVAARYLYRALDMGLIREEFHLYKEL